MSVGLGLQFLSWRVRGGCGKSSDAVSESRVVFFIDEGFLHEICYAWGEGFVVVFTVAVDDDLTMLDGGFVAIEGDLFDGFS